MPEIDSLKTPPDDRKLPFTHADEVARPDYYSVWMNAGNSRRIRAEMTATERCAYMRFTFPSNASSTIIVEASRDQNHAGFANVDVAKQEITGYNPDRMDRDLGPMQLPNFKGYFVVEFHKAFSDSGTYGPTSQQQESATGAYAKFKTTEGEVIEARVGTSFISVEQARQNLRSEIPTWDFDKVRNALRATGAAAASPSKEPQRISAKSSTPAYTTRCSTRAYSRSKAVTIAPSMTRSTTATRTPPTPFGIHFVPKTACSLCSLPSASME